VPAAAEARPPASLARAARASGGRPECAVRRDSPVSAAEPGRPDPAPETELSWGLGGPQVDQDLNRPSVPVLDPDQLKSLAQCAQAELEQFPDGQKLIDVGERDFRFYVVKAGAIES